MNDDEIIKIEMKWIKKKNQGMIKMVANNTPP